MNIRKLYFRLLSFYQIIGGFLGIILIVWALISLSQVQTKGNMFILIGAAFLPMLLYIFSVLCGIVLLKNKNKGINLSLINQLLQVVNISNYGFGFKYISGFYMTGGIDLINGDILSAWGYSSCEILIPPTLVCNKLPGPL